MSKTAYQLIGAVAIVAIGYLGVYGAQSLEQLGYERGVKSSPQTPCYPFVAAEKAVNEQLVQFTGMYAYQQGVQHSVQAMKSYILDSCLTQKEVTVDGDTFICLKKQEM